MTIGAREVVVASEKATARIDRQALTLTLEDASGLYLTETNAPPEIRVGDGAPRGIDHLLSVSQTARGAVLECQSGSNRALWSVEFLEPRAIASRIQIDRVVSAGERLVSGFRAAPGERFYGLTERILDERVASEIAPQEVGHLDRRGEIVSMVVTPTIALYTPLLISSRGWASYVEGTMTGSYDVAASDGDTVRLDFEISPTTRTHGTVLFVGSPETILDSYTTLTGRPFLPPRWAFKHLRWRDEHRIAAPADLDEVPMNADFVDDIRHYESLGIPTGNYEFDRPWTAGSTDHGQQGFTSFRFDPERFPNSEAMIATLKRRGDHVFVFGAPWALGENASDAIRNGWYAPGSDVLIDYTSPDAVAWWQERVKALVDLGISGIKLDRGEEAIPDQATDVWADGRSGREVKNDYPALYARAHFDAFRERLGGDFVHYLRAGYAGSQRYSMFWGGDSPGTNFFGFGAPTDLGLRAAILQLARVAYLGFPIWGSDTGGYYAFGDREVFARWLAFSAFCPLMEIGGGGSHAPWDMPTEPHDDGELIEIYRYYVTLHHELIPLLYSLAIEANASGKPVARPLAFAYPDDPDASDHWDEFLIGEDLLVAPLWRSGDRARFVRIPAGRWYDANRSGPAVVGPALVEVEAPLDRIPLFERAGGIVPLEVSTDVTGHGGPGSDGLLTLDVAQPDLGAGPTRRTFHDDPGDTTAELSMKSEGSSTLTLALRGPRPGYVVRYGSSDVAAVTRDGEPLPRLDAWGAFDAASQGVFMDPMADRTWIKVESEGADVILGLEVE